MRKNTFLKYLLVAAVTSCSTPNYVQNNQPTKFNDEVYFPVHLCNDPQIKRNPSAAESCIALFDEVVSGDPMYAQKLQSDPLALAEAAMNTSTGTDKYPVKLSVEMKRFRDRFLGFIKNTVIREPLTRSFEASLRMRSLLTEKALMKDKYGQYDMVIVGTGVHGVIALQAALAKNPNLKILLVDEGDTAGATFRYGKEVFNINSSNRASGKDTQPLPGEGNINELPGLPIQVSDLTAVKYPSANDLGTALVAGLYSALRQYPNVEVLFNTKATQILAQSKSAQLKEAIALTSGNNPDATIQVDAQKIILTTGLGTPRLVEKVTETLIAKPELSREENGKIPRVIAFEDVIRILGSSNDPAKFFKDKKIAVVGKGDSANVFIEFALGYAAREGYARSSAQDGKVKKIFWIGQEKKDCKDFISDIRSRYQQVSTGFRSSSTKLEGIITPNAAKLSDVKEKGDAKVSAILEDGTSISDLDFIVVTTGFEQNVRSLFADVTNNRSIDFQADVDFFASQFTTLEGPTSTIPKNTKIGRKLAGREIYVLGTAAGKLTAESETVGIIQNTVSIFNNAPRVVAATQQLVENLKPIAPRRALQAITVNKAAKQQTLLVTDIQESRFMVNQTMAFLEATFKEALGLTINNSAENLNLTISLKGDDLKITSSTLVDPTELVKLLAQSREFFSLTRELLKFTPGQNLVLTASASEGTFVTRTAKIETTTSDNDKKPNTASVSNSKIKLRGLLATDKKRDEKGKPRKGTEGLDLTNRATFQTFGIFNPIKPGKFKFGRLGVEKTIDKPFEMSATLVTQRIWALVLLASGEKSPIRLAPSENKNDPKREVLILPNGASLTVRSNHPVEGMNPKKAFEFIDKLNELSNNPDEAIQTLLTNLFPGHRLGDQYDVPTDLQFEYVQRGLGKDNGQYFKAATEGEALNFSWNKSNTIETQAVATLNPRVIDGNPFFDLEGNVRVWVKDPLENPYSQMLAASANLYYARGSSFQDPVLRNTSDDKYTYSNSVGNYSNVGLRLVRTRRP